MKLALLSDIHANIQALDACIVHAQGQGAQRFAVLGDLVGYGGDPGAVVQRVMAMAVGGAMVIKGNHDEKAVAPPLESKTLGDSTAAWTHAQLTDEERRFLDALPMTLQHDLVLLVHASVEAPELWRYVYDRQAAALSLEAAKLLNDVHYVFGGHVHFQTLYHQGSGTVLTRFAPLAGVAIPVARRRHWLATIGSVGQPRDGNPNAMYALLDTDCDELTFHRVPYDHGAAAAAIRRAGLPGFFADRLETGR
jgi:diadenosine tetraphosphatase ApaH/serine/threonine PP2A family protein phosphatase